MGRINSIQIRFETYPKTTVHFYIQKSYLYMAGAVGMLSLALADASHTIVCLLYLVSFYAYFIPIKGHRLSFSL